ncbi:MAG TPA: hypothetical protein VFY80_10495 [Burkholderiales bacterium]|nr:hypothetical protein [Burkholderiales bacterium]
MRDLPAPRGVTAWGEHVDEIALRGMAKWPNVPARRELVSPGPVCGKRRMARRLGKV